MHFRFVLMFGSHPAFTCHGLYSLIFALLISTFGSAKTETTEERITRRLKTIVSSPPLVQKQLDSLSERLTYLGNLVDTRGEEVCFEITVLKAQIAHACANGGKSIHTPLLLLEDSSCTPHHGLYDFFLGGIAYNTGNFDLSVNKFRSAIGAIGIEDRASVMIQLNLSAALEAANRQSEAVDSLTVMLDGAHWKAAPAMADGIYNNQIAINAAAILISADRTTQALQLLGEIDESSLSEYWMVIKLSNEYIALSRLARFKACDSLWTTSLQHIPCSDLPLPLFEDLLGSWLATDSYAYVEQLIREEMVPDQLLDNEGSALYFLLDPQLTDSAREQHWDILVAANQLKREHMNSLAASLYMEGSESEKFEGLKEKLGFQKQISFRWQIATLLLVLIVLTFILGKQYAQRQAENAMRVALQKAASERQSILDVSSKLEITKEDIRKIHMGLTKGHQIGEALLSLQKVEVLHKHTSAAPKALDSINGITDLSESEFTILQLSLDGISNKEIAHQLEVSSGYVYNSRSAIRKKLDIPKESSIRQWIQKQTS